MTLYDNHNHNGCPIQINTRTSWILHQSPGGIRTQNLEGYIDTTSRHLHLPNVYSICIICIDKIIT